MMMNFLDLSAATDEERRLISEILEDTSVVNFAQPLRKHHPENTQQRHKDQQQNSRSRQLGPSEQHNHQHYQNHQQTTHIVKNKTTHYPYQSTQQQQSHVQSNHSTLATNNTNSPNPRLNHIQNHNAPVTLENHLHTAHVQVTPLMAGDINSGVVGLDIQTSQHAGYPIAHPTSAQMQPTYGPPPPHHMYSGHPIFQHYPIPMIPYPNVMGVYGNVHPYTVLPTTNSVVAPRQQAPPQTSQPLNASIASSSHSRSHPHHPRQIKAKDLTSRQNTSMHHNSQHPADNNQPLHNQYNKTTNQVAVGDASVKVSDTNLDIKRRDKTDPNINDTYQVLDSKHRTAKSDGSVTDVAELATSHEQSEESNKKDNNLEQSKNHEEEEVVKFSSDGGFDTQTSSLDVSKQSQDSPSVPTLDKSKISSAEVNCNSIVKQENIEPSKVIKLEKTTEHTDGEKASNGPWSLASSKSWASLFKSDGSTLMSSSMNGELEHNIDLNNSDEENRSSQKKLGNDNDQISSRAATSKEQQSQDAARRALDKMAPKLAQKINSITLKHSLPLLRPRGFINKGNGCYINSTLQALIACPPFYNLMKEIGDLKCLRRENSCTPILDSFAELFLNFPPLDASKKMKQSSSDQRMQINQLQAEALEPKCIYDALGQIKSECLRGAQEDAEEFLSSVLNGLHEEMIGLSETLQSIQNNVSKSQNGHQSDADYINGDNDDNLWREVGPKNRSLPIRTATVINTPIQEIFGGSLFSIRTAGKDRCGHRSPFFDLQLDISGDNVKSLQDAIKSFTAPEIIHDFYCSKTKQKLDAQRITSLDQLPPILILHLKQFIYTQDYGLKKLMKRIEFPIDFELPDSCLHDKNSDKSLRTSRTYKLLAVVYHEGKEAVKGHYLTDVYHIGSSQWIRCDDSNLKVVPAPRIESPESSRTPYLLFYRRLNTLKPPQSNNGNSQHDNGKKKI